MAILEISKEDKKEIFYLYFDQMKSIEEIQHHFNDKYGYLQILRTICQEIGEHNGYTK